MCDGEGVLHGSRSMEVAPWKSRVSFISFLTQSQVSRTHFLSFFSSRKSCDCDLTGYTGFSTIGRFLNFCCRFRAFSFSCHEGLLLMMSRKSSDGPASTSDATGKLTAALYALSMCVCCDWFGVWWPLTARPPTCHYWKMCTKCCSLGRGIFR